MDVSIIESVGSIVVITYLVGLAAKTIPMIEDKFIPVIVGVTGGVLGVVGMNVMPDFPAKDLLNAIAIGVVSGLSSTGANQVVKQLTSKSTEIAE